MKVDDIYMVKTFMTSYLMRIETIKPDRVHFDAIYMSSKHLVNKFTYYYSHVHYDVNDGLVMPIINSHEDYGNTDIKTTFLS